MCCAARSSHRRNSRIRGRHLRAVIGRSRSSMCRYIISKVCDYADHRFALACRVGTQTHCCRVRRNSKIYATHSLDDWREIVASHWRGNVGRTCATRCRGTVTKQYRAIQSKITWPDRVGAMYGVGCSARQPTDQLGQTYDCCSVTLICSRVAGRLLLSRFVATSTYTPRKLSAVAYLQHGENSY